MPKTTFGLEASVMERELYIPLPVTEENRDQYFEELSNISEAENWVEKHSVQDNTNQNEIRIIVNEESMIDNFWGKFFASLGIGFLIPFLTWIFLFLSLGEPCVIFSCSGKSWIFWEYFFANLFLGFMVLVGSISASISSKTIFPILFFFGFCLGSLFGIPVGEGLITGNS